MEFKTKISKLENKDVIIRGQKLSSLLDSASFTDTIFLQLSGRMPTPAESKIFEKMLQCSVDHGMGTTSSLASRVVVSGGNSLNVGVGAGVLSVGNYHGGAIENAMKQFYAWQKLDHAALESQVKSMIENKETIYGFGHRVYKDGDPRVDFLLKVASDVGFKSSFLFLRNIVETAFVEIKAKMIPINIDGIIALFLCDFGFDARLGKGIFIIGRTPGLVAQVHEELTCEKPVRRVLESEIVYEGKEAE